MSGTVDLTTSGSFGSIGGAIFTTDTTHSAGTGGFNTFVQIQHTGTEQGYNTDAAPQFNEGSNHSHNHALLLADVPIFIGDGLSGTEEGVAYREFKLDINENKRLLSLDQLQVWQEEAGNLTNFTPGSGFAGAHTNYLVYNMDASGDNWVALNSNLSTGGGGGDMILLIRNDLFINDGADRYVYLYSVFGERGGVWASDGGFEEWGTAKPAGGSSGGAVLHLDKTASVPGGTADTAGETITYSYAVSNFGSVPLTGITVTDPSVGDLAPVTSGGFNVGDTDHDNQLDTTETWTYTAHHVVTQAEIDTNNDGTGSIDNTATADSTQTAPVTDSASVPVERRPHFTVTKTATIPDTDTPNDPTLHDGKIDSPADDISYTITLVNDGNTTLHTVVVNDSLSGPLTIHTESGGTGVNGDDIFDVGETWTYTASYDVTQNDIDNHGSVDGTSDDNIHNQVDVLTDETTASATADVAIDYRPHLTLTKTAAIPDTDTPGDPTLHDGKIDSPADDISYTFTVVNDGNVTLHDILLNDTLLGVLTTHTESGGTGTNGDDILDVGETWSFTASYDVTQADIDNHGSVDGTPDNNIHNEASVFTDEGASGTASADVGIDYRPTVDLEKTASVPGGTADTAGELIEYTITVANTGNVTLTNPTVSDNFASNLHGLDLNEDTFNDGDANMNGAIDVGETWSYLANHVVTQQEIDNNGGGDGTIDNTATVTTDQGATDSDSASVPVEQRPEITLVKTGTFADDNNDGFSEVGEHINYTFGITNSGNVTLHNVGVSDVNGDVSVTGTTIASLAPGATDSTTWSATHEITQTDIDNGYFDNSAVAIADEASDPDSEHVVLPPAPPRVPDLVLTKTSGPLIDGDESGGPSPADPIQYFFSVINNGTAALHDTQLDDTLFGMIAFTPDSPDGNGLLDPGETWLMSRTYLTTADDIGAGHVDNDATVTGLTPTNVLVTSNTAHWHLDF